MKKRNTIILCLMLLMVIAMLIACASTPTREGTSNMDDRIESSAKKSYVFKTYLKDDDIQIQSRDGAVILTGTVSEESHKSLARDTVVDLPGVKTCGQQAGSKRGTPR